MDGLALLCNLFADGPVTLKRLRTARVATLGELERMAPERLAEWLHASVPQARAFAEEARRLVRRLAEESMPLGRRAPALPQARAAGHAAQSAPLATPVPDQALVLRPGMFPGLDEPLCGRLHDHHVRTVRALIEFAGIALARRTGIPYATLLELARNARRFAAEGAREPGREEAARAEARIDDTLEIVPFRSPPERAGAGRDTERADELGLSAREAGAAGPFG